MLPHEFHALAQQELEEAVEHYERLASGKGLDLASKIEAAIKRACTFPDLAPVVRGTTRAMVVQPSSRWAYTVYYQITSGRIRVMAIAHQSRRPLYWSDRR